MRVLKPMTVLLAAAGFALAAGPADPPARAGGQEPRPGTATERTSPAVETPAAREAAWLAGEWKVKQVEAGGGPLFTPEELKTARVTFGNGRAALSGFQVLFLRDFTFTIDPTQTPKSIDITLSAGPRKGETFRGIYVARRDEVRFCLRLDNVGLPRPAGFATSPGSGIHTFILEPVGEKPAPPALRPAPAPTSGAAPTGKLTVRPAAGRNHDERFRNYRVAFLELANDGPLPVQVFLDDRSFQPVVTDSQNHRPAGIDVSPHVPARVERSERMTVARGGVIPAGGYAGVPTVAGRPPEYPEQGEGTVVVVGTRMWKLPAGRYTLDGQVELGFTELPRFDAMLQPVLEPSSPVGTYHRLPGRANTRLRLPPTAFTLP